MKTLRVIAVGEARVPYIDEVGRLERGRYVGRDFDGKPEAQVVRATNYVQRALSRGELAPAPDAAPPVTEAEAAPTPAPAPADDEAAPDTDTPTEDR